MKTRATRLAVILVLGLFASCTLALAQDNTEPLHSFGCSSTQAESTFSADLNHLSNIQLIPVTDSKLIQQAQAGAVHTLYSKIDASKYEISRVDFYIHQDRPEEPAQ